MIGTATKAAISLAAVSLLCSCSHGDPDHPDTGGVTLGQGLCGGVTVVSSDFQSTGVAVLGFDGSVLGRSVVSGASADVGLSSALSGDMVVPTLRTASPDFVLIDRSPASVVTWVDASAGEVTAQLSVGTSSFAANPQDYVRVSQHKAYVSRYADNVHAGEAAFDTGGDVLIIDPTVPETIGRVDLHGLFPDASIQPRPNRMVVVGDSVYVLCAALSSDFKQNGDSVLVEIDTRTDTIRDSVVLTDSHGCLGLAASPDGSTLAVACPGDFAGTPFPKLDHSALVIVDRTAGLRQMARLGAATFSDGPLAFSVAFASNTSVLFTTLGTAEVTPSVPDRLIRTSLDGTAHEVLVAELASPPVTEEPTLGEVRCESSCGSCFLANPAQGVVERFAIDGDTLGQPSAIAIDDGTGLPPRYLGSIGSP